MTMSGNCNSQDVLYSAKAEQSVLGGLMLNNTIAQQIIQELKIEDFYLEEHRLIFRSIINLANTGEKIDLVTVSDALKKMNIFDKCGGDKYLAEIELNVPAPQNILAYAKIVRERAQKRKFIGIIKECETGLLNGKDLNNIVEMAFEKLKNFSLTVSGGLDISKACLSYQDLMAKTIVRERLLTWLPEGGLAMVYAARGLGKTFFALFLSYSIACSKRFMCWDILKNAPCLYVDGEMSLVEMKERAQKIFAVPPPNWHMLSHEIFFNQFERDLYITNFEIQNAILKMIDEHGIKFLVLDNLSSLCRIKEDKSDDWRNVMQPFLMACRRRGVAVLTVHHTSKSGDQRGTSTREDPLDTSIKLSKLDNEKNNGASFYLEFTKNRSCFGNDVKKLAIKLIDRNGFLDWDIISVEQNTKNQMLNLITQAGEEGISAADIAEELGISQSMVSQYRHQLIAEKLITNTRGKQPLKSIEYG